jgi:hypothetical protein
VGEEVVDVGVVVVGGGVVVGEVPELQPIRISDSNRIPIRTHQTVFLINGPPSFYFP